MASQTASHPRALVTGASSGIGAAFADRLAQDGYALIVVARRRERLDALAEQLRKTYGAEVEVIAADLSQSDQLWSVEKRIEEDAALEMLVNNAGYGGYMPFIDLAPDQAEDLIRLQIVAVTRLTRAALPGMIASKRGSIINVSSRLAFSGAMKAPYLPKRATYAATKAYINTFTQILCSELEGTGVQVQALCPGVVLTEFHTRMGIDPANFPPEIVMKPEAVVEASLAALRTGEVICLPALDDPGILTQIEEAQAQLLQRSGGGAVANRYTD